MASKTLTILHISDTHFGPTEDYEYRGYNPCKRYNKIVQYISESKLKYDAIIHTGDIAGDKKNHALPFNYKLASLELEKLTSDSTIPAFFLPGNHDDKELSLHYMQRFTGTGTKIIREAHCYSFEFKEHVFIMLDSVIPEKRKGVLKQGALRFLSETLKRTELPAIICLHHPPCPVNVDWIDKTMLLKNQKDFNFYSAAYQNRIKAVLFGHIHFNFKKEEGSTTYSCTPSTLFQFLNKQDAPDAACDSIAGPGFNLIEVNNSGIKINSYSI